MRVDIVGEEKQFEDKEDDEEFDEDDQPQGAPEHHVAETVGVEVIDAVDQTVSLIHFSDFRLLSGGQTHKQDTVGDRIVLRASQI